MAKSTSSFTRNELLERQRLLKNQILKEARMAGERVAPQESDREPLRSFHVARPERESTFEDFARYENLKRKPYSWMNTGPYG